MIMKKNKSYKELYKELFSPPEKIEKPGCDNCLLIEEKLNDVRGKYGEEFNLLCDNCEKGIEKQIQKHKSERVKKTKLE